MIFISPASAPSFIRRSSALGAAIAVVLLLSACNGKQQNATARNSLAGPCQPSSPITPSHLKKGKGRLKVVPVASYVVNESQPGRIVTWDHYIARTPNDDQVAVCDLNTGIEKTVVRRESPEGVLDWVRGSKDTIVYSELAFPLVIEAGPIVPWSVTAMDLKTGRTRTIAKSRTKKDLSFLPYPEFEWPWVVGVVEGTNPPGPGAADLGADLVAYDVRDGAKRVLVSGVNPGSITIHGAKVYYAIYSGPDRRDIFMIPVDGSAPPKQITNSGRVQFPRPANGAITWQEPPPGVPIGQTGFEKQPSPGAQINPYVWVLPLTSADPGPPIRFGEGSNTFPGKGFVIWLSPDGLFARDPLSKSKQEPIKLAGHEIWTASRWWVFGDRVVWVTVKNPYREAYPHTVHVARIVKT